MDINCGTYLLRHTKSAVEKGNVQEEDINRALLNLFMVQLRLGLFEADQNNQWFTRLGHTDVCTENHRNLALEAARQGIVLLKNENGLLPLKRNKVESIAVIGPAGHDADILGGDYSGLLFEILYHFVFYTLLLNPENSQLVSHCLLLTHTVFV